MSGERNERREKGKERMGCRGYTKTVFDISYIIIKISMRQF
jgi:hypothetical protein